MADHVESIATQVRLARTDTIHDLACAVTDPVVGRRRYKTECHRYLYNDEGALLTTRHANCYECAKARAMTRAQVRDAARAESMLVGASA